MQTSTLKKRDEKDKSLRCFPKIKNTLTWSQKLEGSVNKNVSINLRHFRVQMGRPYPSGFGERNLEQEDEVVWVGDEKDGTEKGFLDYDWLLSIPLS